MGWLPVPAGAGAEVPSGAGEAERRKFHQRLVALRCTSSPIPLTDGTVYRRRENFLYFATLKC
jgi:hypothetical protein